MKTNKCKVCGKDKGRNKIYCSNRCRYYSEEVILEKISIWIAGFLVGFTVLALIFVGVDSRIKSAEKSECLKWQEMPTENVADWQVEQCSQFDINLDK